MEVAETTFGVAQLFSEKAMADYRLVVKAQKDDQKAFTELLSRYWSPVYYMMKRMVKNYDDAEDLSIGTFEQAFRVIKCYRPTGSFSTWLFKIASNNAISFIRANRQKTVSLDKTQEENDSSGLLDSIEPLVETEKNAEENIISDEVGVTIREIVALLPEDYRRIVEDHYFNDKTYSDIAKELGEPIGTVKARLKRCRSLLLTIIQDRRIYKEKL